MYQDLRSEKMPESVHLCDFPSKSDEAQADLYLEQKMEETRNVVNLALAQRATCAIKVRQPVAWIKIKDKNSKIKNELELLDLIKDEVNTKEILFDDSIEKEVELNTEITEELRQEGVVRDMIRDIQTKRKEQGLKPEDRISVTVFIDEKEKAVVLKNQELLMKEVRANAMVVEALQDGGATQYKIEVI